MIVCKYSKLGPSVYVPHLDLLRAFGMAIRRVGVDIAFSEGFNPHARLFFSQPLPLGTLSEAEYFCADSSENAKTFMDKLNTSLPNGIKILDAINLETNPNPAALAAIADYEVALCNPLSEGIDLSYLNNADSIIISYEAKGKRQEKDVRANVYSISNTKDKILLSIACGNINLRADRLTLHLLHMLGHESHFSVKKTAVYAQGKINLDKIFFNK